MASNYTKAGVDLDNILITQTNKTIIPAAYRKSGNNSVWGVYGLGYGWGYNNIGQLGIGYGDSDSGYPDYTFISGSSSQPRQIVVVNDLVTRKFQTSSLRI